MFPCSRINYNLLKTDKTRPQRSWIENICLVTMVASYVVTIIHKAHTGTEFFLLQVM